MLARRRHVVNAKNLNALHRARKSSTQRAAARLEELRVGEAVEEPAPVHARIVQREARCMDQMQGAAVAAAP